MRISAINNNQFKVIHNNNRQNNNNVSFNGIREVLNKDVSTAISPKTAFLSLLAVTIALPFIAAFTQRAENKRTINEIGNFINSDNYNKDSLKVKDFTNDGVLDFELVDKEGKKVVYDAKKNKLLEFATTLQEMKE